MAKARAVAVLLHESKILDQRGCYILEVGLVVENEHEMTMLVAGIAVVFVTEVGSYLRIEDWYKDTRIVGRDTDY